MALELGDGFSVPLDHVTSTFGILAKKRELQVAWAAGLFEGEGCISNDRQKRGMRRALTLVSTDRDVLEAFVAVVGAGRIIDRPDRDPRHKIQWQWKVTRWREIEPILQILLPYLGERRTAKAMELLATPAKRQGNCDSGHPLSGPGADIYTNGKARPACAICARARSKANRERKVKA